MSKKISDKSYFESWQEFRDNIGRSTPIDSSETEAQKKRRVASLELNDEAWFKYYFPNFYTSEPAPFHLKATKRVLNNPEFFEVRAWCRELSKSGRTMMEVLKLVLTGAKKNVIMTSATLSDAERLLLPYKSILETNNRIKNDYGIQESVGNWTSSEFITKKGVSFRALGAGQSPRGTRKDEVRPDVILIDDIDTDEEVRNPDRIDKKVDWVMEALYGTRSISNPLLLIVCGNIIGKKTTVTELGKKADVFEVVNIRDKNGKSTWPAKNTEEMIDRVLSKISYRAGQKEYFNNPMKEGKVFKKLVYGKAPKLSTCEKVIVYADPSTSNKDKSGGNASSKAVVIIGFKALRFYIYWIRVDQTNNSKFVDWLFDAYDYLVKNEVDIKNMQIENNSLQDSHYEQVIQPEIKRRAKIRRARLPIKPDTRNKSDKFFRIEGTLEPIHRDGDLVFDEKLKDTPDMERAEEQMLDVSPNSKTMDFPDALEGGVWQLQKNNVVAENKFRVGKRVSFKS
jgi:hypothetical protein